MVASTFSNSGNIRFTAVIYDLNHQFRKQLPSLVLSTLDYESFVLAVEGSFGKQILIKSIFATAEKPTTTLSAIVNEVNIVVAQINQPSNVNIACVQFDIICEKPNAVRHGVVLSEADFKLLQQNDHIMAVVNIQHIQGIANIDYHLLAQWINDNSVTPVPDVPANH